MFVNCFILQFQQVSASSFVHFLHLIVLECSNAFDLRSSFESGISWHGIRWFLKGRFGISYWFWVTFHCRLWLILLLHLRLHLWWVFHILLRWIFLKLPRWILVCRSLILLLHRLRWPEVFIPWHFVTILILLCRNLHRRLIVLTAINLLLLPARWILLF